MIIFQKSSYANVFQDSMESIHNHHKTYSLVMARNEYQSYQLCLRNEDAFTIKSVTFSDFTDGNGNRISSENTNYNFVEYVHIPQNSVTLLPDDTGILRQAPGWFPDPLSNNRSIKVEARTTQPVWITVYVPAQTPAGHYQCDVFIHTTRGEFKRSIALEVCAVTLPESNAGELKYMHHQQITGPWGMYCRPGYNPHDPIKVCYGYERWTPEWWRLVGDIAQKMKQHRQNMLFVNTPALLLDGGTVVDENGKYTFNWSRFDEYVQFFIDAGVVKGLEGMHFDMANYVTGAHATVLLRMGKHGMELTDSNYKSEESKNWINQFLPALVSHIDEMGWTAIWYQHISDEIGGEALLNQYKYYLEELKKHNAKFLYGDPIFVEQDSKSLVDIGCNVSVPIQFLFEDCRPMYDKMMDDGINVYVYNSSSPGGKWLNRFVDQPVWNMRTLGWLLYSWNVKGYLHWGYNFWIDWMKNEEYLEIGEEEVKGDHYTIYPDYFQPHMVRSSIRYEANRDAAQDFELLTILGRSDPEKAKSLVAAIAENSKETYCRDISVMREKHAELVREAARVAGEK